MQSILVISNDPNITEDVLKALSGQFRIDVSSSIEEGLFRFKKQRYDFTFIEVQLFQKETTKRNIKAYKKVLQPFWSVFPAAQIIVICQPPQLRNAVSVVKAGANDYLTTPLDPIELKYIIECTEESTQIQLELDYLRDQFWQTDDSNLSKTKSPKMKKVLDKVKSVAPTKTTVLLTGDTGVGKGTIAQLIHEKSSRSDQPFIHVHCGAIPDTLLESELFGHEKGAFTGAIKRKLGRFEIAKGGSIFLDEIATISPAAQSKLLQVLQDNIFQRVGGEALIETDVRVIAAANQDLKKMSQDGEFRSDLYYRLSVFPIEIPSLSERIEDIPAIVDVLIEKLNQTHMKDIQDVHPLVMEAFEEYGWPGNIRELENIVERAYILESSNKLTPENFPEELFNLDTPQANVVLDTSLTLKEVRRNGVEHIERQYLKELLEEHNGRINKTSAAAGITTRQLHKLLTRHGIRKEEFKQK